MKNEPWALADFAFQDTMAVFDAVMASNFPKLEREVSTAQGDIAVIDVFGTLTRYPSLVSVLTQWSTYNGIAEQLRQAEQSPGVSAIVLNVDSPGGLANGALEIARLIAKVKRTKPVVAVVRGMCCSAAYYLAAGASQIYAEPDAFVGSVGTYQTLRSFAGAEKKAGIITEVVRSGSHKAMGHPSLELDRPTIDYFQEIVDELNGFFLDHVYENRTLSTAQQAEIKTAKTFLAKGAMTNGLVDGVGFADEILSTLQSGNSSSDYGDDFAMILSQVAFNRRTAKKIDKAQEHDNEMLWQLVDAIQETDGCTRHEAIRQAKAAMEKQTTQRTDPLRLSDGTHF